MSNFGYSDDDFEDYSWFRNCIDNSEGKGSGSCGCGGNDPNSRLNKYGGKIAMGIFVLAVVLIALDFMFDGQIAMFINHGFNW